MQEDISQCINGDCNLINYNVFSFFELSSVGLPVVVLRFAGIVLYVVVVFIIALIDVIYCTIVCMLCVLLVVTLIVV